MDNSLNPLAGAANFPADLNQTAGGGVRTKHTALSRTNGAQWASACLQTNWAILARKAHGIGSFS
jgi:hypothetical protein